MLHTWSIVLFSYIVYHMVMMARHVVFKIKSYFEYIVCCVDGPLVICTGNFNSKIDSRSADQIPCLLWKLKVRYRMYNACRHRFLSRVRRITTSCLYISPFNIILLSTDTISIISKFHLHMNTNAGCFVDFRTKCLCNEAGL